MNANLAVPSATVVPQSRYGMGFGQWREVLEKAYGLNCERHPGPSCEVEIDMREVGAVCVAEVRMSAQTIAPRRKMEPTEDQLYLKLVVGGTAKFEQNGERRCFPAGSIVIVDPAVPFLESVEDATQLVVVTCPKPALRERGFRSHFNHWLAPDIQSPDVQTVHDMIRVIASRRGGLAEETRTLLGAQLLDLMDVLLNADSCRANRTAEAARYRVKRFIAQHIGDETLDATTIANSAALSISYLNRIFREDGMSPMRYLWNQRLERAYQFLTSAKSDGLRIEEIAWRCGFASAAHFSRLFRQRYGATPKELREGGKASAVRE
jgi:AraC-like DNA-binding protein